MFWGLTFQRASPQPHQHCPGVGVKEHPQCDNDWKWGCLGGNDSVRLETPGAFMNNGPAPSSFLYRVGNDGDFKAGVNALPVSEKGAPCSETQTSRSVMKDLNLSGVYHRKAQCLLLAIAFSRLFFLSPHKNHMLDSRGPFPQAASLELMNSVKLLKRIVAG